MESDFLFNAVNQIIDANIDTGALFEELCTLSKSMKEKNYAMYVPCNYESAHQSRQRLIPIPTLATWVIDISQKCKEEGLILMNKTYMERFHCCLQHLKHSKNNNIDPSLFSSMLLKYQVHVEILWHLHKTEILPFETYLESKLSEDVFKESLSKDLIFLCTGSEETQHRRQTILSGFIIYFVKKSFRAPASNNRIFTQIFDSILRGFLESTQHAKEFIALPFVSQLDVKTISDDRLKKFCRHAISLILNFNDRLTVEKALISQSEWKSLDLFGAKRMLMSQLVLPLESQEMLELLKSSMNNSQINPLSTLVYLSVMYILFPMSSAEVKDYIKVELTTGLENSDMKKLSLAFLIARQSSIVGQESFGSYSSWFELTFNSSCSPLNATKQKFSTLMRFLSNLVPTDDAEYLKAHILKKPFIPPKCADIMEDYVLLAKTRLKDLKVSLADDRKVNNTSTLDPVEEEIQAMLEAYEGTGKIPSTFFRMWMFRKPYLLQTLLPALLKPRCLPEIPDVRMKFVDELFKTVDLDPNLYKRYKQACEQEKQAWMEGVFDSEDDDDLQLEILPPKERLRYQLTKYCELLENGSDSKVSETLNSVIEALSGLLVGQRSLISAATSSIQVDLSKPLSSAEREFVLELTGCLQVEQNLSFKQFEGVNKLVSVLADHFHQFHSVLLRHIIMTLSSKTNKEQLLIQSLAWQMMTMALTSHNRITEVVITTCDGGQIKTLVYATPQEAMFSCLESGPKIQQLDIWRFWIHYTLWAVQYFDTSDVEKEKMEVAIVDPLNCSLQDIVPEVIIKQLLLVGERCGVCEGFRFSTGFESSSSEASKLDLSLYSLVRWQKLSRNIKPSLSDWVEFELKIDPSDDFLPMMQRTTYLWKTSCNFLSRHVSTGCNDNSRFCRDFTFLLATSNATSHGETRHSSQTYSCLVGLLTRHIYQLPGSDKGSILWLTSLLEAALPSQLNSVLRIVFSLPPHLLLCNSLQDRVSKTCVDSSLLALKYFSNSNHYIGAFLSLDAIIYLLQSYISVKPMLQSQAEVARVIRHPLVTMSILVHYKVLKSLSLLKELGQSFEEEFNLAVQWAESLIKYILEPFNVKWPQAWMKGASLFALVYHIPTLSGVSLPEKFIKSEKECVLYFLQVSSVYFTANGMEVLKQAQRSVAKLFLQIISTNGGLLIQLLDNLNPEMTSFCCDLGLDQSFRQMRDLCLLKLITNISAQVLVRSTTENVTLSVLMSYSQILTSAYTGGLSELHAQCTSSETNLTDWMKQLVDSCSSHHLQQINLLSPPLSQPGPHVVLYMYLAEKKRKR
ncbi:uncharacterized protein LOC106062077 [Biomphalaria glabrata]|uniref:Uncharacterized protein LOC106062077 n=1 Tax=Biomphalaria glabrata TaxID=6526 RepID=A0A9W3B013_BIOGL|nr:uncharacterized protein LOC106062077 [Biomphalaria glabrata]